MTNPYAPPTVQPSTDAADIAVAKTRISRPAVALCILSWTNAAIPASVLAISFILSIRGDLASGQILVFAMFSLQLATLIAIAIGAGKMAQLRSFRAGRVAAVMSCIPGVSPFLLLGIPFGIWSLLLLADPDVRHAFPDQPRPAQ